MRVITVTLQQGDYYSSARVQTTLFPRVSATLLKVLTLLLRGRVTVTLAKSKSSYSPGE